MHGMQACERRRAARAGERFRGLPGRPACLDGGRVDMRQEAVATLLGNASGDFAADGCPLATQNFVPAGELPVLLGRPRGFIDVWVEDADPVDATLFVGAAGHVFRDPDP